MYSPAITDFIFMVRDTSYMFITGPDVVKTVTQEDMTQEELGGASVHTKKSGVAHGAYDNDVEMLRAMRKFYDYLPLNNKDGVPSRVCSDPRERADPALNNIVPLDANLPYDMKKLVKMVVDDHEFFETSPDFSKEHCGGFRSYGRSYSGSGSKSAFGAGRLSGYQCLSEGCSFRAFLRCIQHSLW